MSNPEIATSRRKPPAVALWGALTVGLAVILVGLLFLFIMPSLKSGPSELPVGVVGAPNLVAQLEGALEEAQPGAFDLRPVESAAALEALIEARELSGGLVIIAEGVQSVVASAGSAAVSSTITATAGALAENLGLADEVRDIVPLPSTDPSGIGIGGLAFPLVFGGIVPAVAYRTVLAGRRGWVLAGVLGFAAVGGLVVAAVLRFAFGSIEGDMLPVAAAVAFGIAALALPLAGLNEFFGAKGFTIGAMTMMLSATPSQESPRARAGCPPGSDSSGSCSRRAPRARSFDRRPTSTGQAARRPRSRLASGRSRGLPSSFSLRASEWLHDRRQRAIRLWHRT